jgi:hypothetical protein
VPHAKIEEITNNFPNLTRALWWDIAVDAAIHREWMISMGRRSAYEQIAHLLCEMLLRLRIIGRAEGNSYEFPSPSRNWVTRSASRLSMSTGPFRRSGATT